MPEHNDEVYHAAQTYVRAGLSLTPIWPIMADRPDLEKAAVVKWTEYQHRLPTENELRQWFDQQEQIRGVAIIGGAISGNLEILDFDSPQLFDAFRDLVAETELAAIMDALPMVLTPTGGTHVYYRCEEPPKGNLKLAWKLSSIPVGAEIVKEGSVRSARLGKKKWPIVTDSVGQDKIKEIGIETRGEGGYVLAPPTPAECHPAQKGYDLFQGDLTAIPVIGAGERSAILALAATFNEHVEVPQKPRTARPVARTGSGLRPGEDYDVRGDWRELVQRHAWRFVKQRGETEYWVRPGKDFGFSASWNHRGSGLFWNWSPNAYPLEVERSYTPFGLYTILEHGGDFEAAARALGQAGYGEQAKPKPSLPPPPSDADAPVTRNTHAFEIVDGGARDDPHKTWHRTDIGNAERLVHQHGNDLRYVGPWEKWLVWNGRYWEMDDTLEVDRRATQTARTIYIEAGHTVDKTERDLITKWAMQSEDKKRLNAMVSIARSRQGIPLRVRDLDTDIWLLNCTNGTLDLRTGELQPHTRAHHITKIAPVSFEPDAECPLWDAFLARILPDRELVQFIQQAIGSCLSGSTHDQVLYILHGLGSNGKSTLLETVSSMLGDYALETPPETLMAKKNDNGATNDLARLRGARFVSAREPDEGARLAEGLVKSMTGGDKITARFLHKEFFEFTPEFKLFLATNHKPSIRGTDKGIWRRIRYVGFEVEIPEAERDVKFKDKLLKELPGILAWAWRGCQSWLKNGLLKPDAVSRGTAAYQEEMDPLAGFLADCCTVGPSFLVRAAELYTEYERWCASTGSYVLKQNSFGRKLTDRGFALDRPGGVSFRHGIGLTSQREVQEAMQMEE